MTTRFRRASVRALAAVGLVLAPATAVGQSPPIGKQVMLVNFHTGKCATIAGGVSTENNVDAVQYNCDADSSRRWRMAETGAGAYQIRNVKTGKCLTIAGGVSPENNLRALQYNCDSDPSRTWQVTDVTGSGVHQLRNAKTGKCLTVAGGTSAANNLTLVQYECDADPSRRWILRLKF